MQPVHCSYLGLNVTFIWFVLFVRFMARKSVEFNGGALCCNCHYRAATCQGSDSCQLTANNTAGSTNFASQTFTPIPPNIISIWHQDVRWIYHFLYAPTSVGISSEASGISSVPLTFSHHVKIEFSKNEQQQLRDKEHEMQTGTG